MEVTTENNKISLVQFGQDSASSAVSIRYLSGILCSHGYKTTVICIELSKQQGNKLSWDYGCYDLTDDTIKNLFSICCGSLFIGFNVYSFVAHIVKKCYASAYNLQQIPIVVGGPHPTLDPYHSSSFSDYVCVGDGERAIVALADKLRTGNIVHDNQCPQVAENILSSAVLRRSKEELPLFGIEAPLDSQSLPDYSFESEYYLSDHGVEEITRGNAANYINMYATFFSRGCVNNCSYCGHEMIAKRSGFKKRIKAKELSHFIKELRTIRSRYPWITQVVFFDPNILSNRKDSLQIILREYRDNVNLPLSVTGFTFNQINEKILRDFLSAGMNSIILGIESGSRKIKELFNRNESNDQIIKIDNLLQHFKKEVYFSVQYDVILDCPWETPDEALESLVFVSQLKGYDRLDLFSLRFFPGTRLFEKALAEGIVKKEEKDKECQRVYRKLNCTYENFLFLLVRDNVLRKNRTLSLAIKPSVLTFMRKLFRNHGYILFEIYGGKAVTRMVRLRRRISKVQGLIRIFGIKKTINILRDKMWSRPESNKSKRSDR